MKLSRPYVPHSALLTGISNRDLQACQTVEQRAPCDAQLTCRARAIATVLVQAIDQEHPLDPFKALAQRRIDGLIGRGYRNEIGC